MVFERLQHRGVALDGFARDPRTDAGAAHRSVQNAHGHTEFIDQLFGKEIGGRAHAENILRVARIPIAVLRVGPGQLIGTVGAVFDGMRHLQHAKMIAAGNARRLHGSALRRAVEVILHIALPEAEPELTEHHVRKHAENRAVLGKDHGVGVKAAFRRRKRERKRAVRVGGDRNVPNGAAGSVRQREGDLCAGGCNARKYGFGVLLKQHMVAVYVIEPCAGIRRERGADRPEQQ